MTSLCGGYPPAFAISRVTLSRGDMDAVVVLQKLNRIRKLSESGRSAAVVAELGTMPPRELARSPTLALLFGIAKGRLGHHAAGKQWVATALDAAAEQGDANLRGRALNVYGAIAFHEGHI